MSKFTPGDWIFDDEYILSPNRGFIIADLMAIFNKEEFEANGRLISSAPKMYECLKSLRDILNDKSLVSKDIDKIIKFVEGKKGLFS